MTIEQRFGLRIREIRHRQQISQEELAFRCGLSKNYISDDVYKNIQNQLISYRSASNQQRINQEIRQNLIAKNKTNRANSSDIAKRKMILDDATALDLLELQQILDI